MTTRTSTIVWTWTDEAPAPATLSLLPIVRAFTKGTGISAETRNISLAGRILANFPEYLTEEQRIPDDLAQLGELTHAREANIIKLPNISASVPQLKGAILELQSKGFRVPDYPENPKDDAGKAIRTKYGKVLGSAVNPMIRQGNSDRRLPLSVKAFARKHPQKLGAWSADSKSHVAHMRAGDFYGSETSVTITTPDRVRYEFVAADETVTVLKKKMRFSGIAEKLIENEAGINAELIEAQGKAVDMGGHYYPDLDKATKAMRPSPTLNAIIDALA